jgi:histidinol-phosphate aminotransferase
LRVLARGGNPAGVAAVRAERAPLAAALQALGFAALPSQANFVFATGRPAAASWLVQSLRAQGIGIRSFRSDDPQLAGAVRITCPGNAADFARLGQALAAARSQHTAAADGGGA